MSPDPTGPDRTDRDERAAQAPEPPPPDSNQLAVVFHRVRGMGQRMQDLADRLEQVEQRAAPAPPAPDGAAPAAAALPGWSWGGLEPADRAERLRELHQWVTWLVDTYEVSSGQLPDCWYRHGSMTADLRALQAAWTAAYLDPEADPDRPSRWHDTLERTLRRIREWDRHGCGRNGSHTDQTDNIAADGLGYPESCSFEQYVSQVAGDLSHSTATVPSPA